MFLHMSVHRGGIPACLAGLWGVYPNMPCRFPGPHPGGSLRGLAGGVSRPTPRGEVEGSGRGGLQAHTWGDVSQHALRQTPSTWQLLLRAVRILLECILVPKIVFDSEVKIYHLNINKITSNERIVKTIKLHYFNSWQNVLLFELSVHANLLIFVLQSSILGITDLLQQVLNRSKHNMKELTKFKCYWLSNMTKHYCHILFASNII